MINSVAIIGLGAVGILYSHRLTDVLGKQNVQVVADSARIARYEAEGVFVNEQRCDFQYVSAQQAEQTDLLIFATKYYGLSDAIESARPVCGENTIVMSFLNGVTSEDIIRERLHPKHLLYTTVQGMDATKIGNRMVYTRAGSVTFGNRDNRHDDVTAAVEQLFRQCGIAYQVSADILHSQWSKWMLNVGVNQTCAVFGVGYAGVQPGGAYRSTMIAAMEEAKAVANAEGIDLSETELSDWVALIDELSPDGEPSMRQDTRAGRQTEVDLFSGTVCKLAKKHGISTPWNDRFLEALTRK